jgi:RimJ/RimL family protein N-acetyltransferase
VLEPLRVEHAVELEPLLADPALYGFIGGGPETPDALAARVQRQAAGVSPDGTEVWLNWVIRAAPPPDAMSATPLPTAPAAPRDSASTGPARPLVGTFQGTLTGSQAELAWVVGTAHQGRGFASEAALAVAAWLRSHGVSTLTAHIHPDHAASQRVARRLGLEPTDTRQDGEVRWVSTSK